MNLTKLVITCLVEGIREKQRTGNKYVRGCLAFFMLFYFEHVKTKFQSWDNRPVPSLSLWDQNAIKQMIGVIKTSDWYKLKENSICTIMSHLCKGDIHSSAKFMKDEDGIKDESKGGTEFHQNIGENVKPNDQLSSIVEMLDRLEKLIKGFSESVTPTYQLSNTVERLDRLEKFIIGVNEDLTNRLDGLVDKAMMRFRNELETSTIKVENSFNVILQQLHKRNYVGSQTKKPFENQNEYVQNDHDRHHNSHNEVERTNIPTRSKKCNSKESTPQKMTKDIHPTFNIENDVSCKDVSSASNNVQHRGSEVPTTKKIVSPTLKPKSITSSLSATLAQRIRIHNRRLSKPGSYEKSPWLVKKPTNKRTKKTMKLNNETNEEVCLKYVIIFLFDIDKFLVLNSILFDV
ncbi:hypothetical protein ACJIZ3_023864 [Penstemon smallii]|uniref:Uncharacterized protein n=1 Tax=Penstemon smallii TaxID=265156 RepID=A0ABD3TS81_9LAMI